VPIPGHSAWAQEGTHGAVAGSGGSKSPGGQWLAGYALIASQ
jgi:hypothetical protein